MTRGDDGGFTLPIREPLTDPERRWMETMRSIVGGHLPPLTLGLTQDLQKIMTRKKGQ